MTIGGGTGSYAILSGLKNLSDVSLTALVSMADNGGSTGVLRDELGVLPPGDVRQCLVALSEHTSVVRALMSYRFTAGKLSGHSFGNIFLAALEKVTGDFAQGVEIASEILKVKGRVIPITKNHAELVITLKNKKVVRGEDAVNHADLQEFGVEKIGYARKVLINEHARRAIKEADVIIIGPGNYYCSILPNLIVSGFVDAIGKSKAKIIVPVNLTNKQGHTMHWSVSDYIESLERYIGKKVDTVFINKEMPSEKQISLYKLNEGDGVLVVDDFKDKRAMRLPLLSRKVIKGNKGDILRGLRSFIRHDPLKVACGIQSVLKKL
ncbi:MAG: putative gluconeosis factor [Patescibacteria group bacterium]|nr:putative gluconeosis factor [Patescibacteria group bacterium]